ncbi:MAG: TIGR03032 family protein [Gemmataceae bacterium]
MAEEKTDAPKAEEEDGAAKLRSVHTTSMPQLLKQLGVSIAISTYQAGKVIIARAEGDKLNTHFRNFNTPMGMALHEGRLAIGTKLDVQEMVNQYDVAVKLKPEGKHDACFMPRYTHFTGNIGIHEMAWVENEIWLVNTRFSCICTLRKDASFIPRWRPKFVTALASEDRCHLNAFGVRNGKIKYVTALGATDTNAGWRENKARGGVLMDFDSNEFISQGLSMPHSPRWYNERLWILESGAGSISLVDESSGRLDHVCMLPGFTRGVDFFGPYAFIGLSQVRESAVFSGIPITERLPKPEDRSCGVWVVDLRTGQIVAFLRFEEGVQEIFSVLVLPYRFPELLNEEDDEFLANSFMLPDEYMKEVAFSPPPTDEQKTEQ